MGEDEIEMTPADMIEERIETTMGCDGDEQTTTQTYEKESK